MSRDQCTSAGRRRDAAVVTAVKAQFRTLGSAKSAAITSEWSTLVFGGPSDNWGMPNPAFTALGSLWGFRFYADCLGTETDGLLVNNFDFGGASGNCVGMELHLRARTINDGLAIEVAWAKARFYQ